MKKILFVASEGVPFIKTGGLADVVGSLPKCIDKEYYDVRVILPKYVCMSQEMKDRLNYRTHFYMDFHWQNQYVGILEAEMDREICILFQGCAFHTACHRLPPGFNPLPRLADRTDSRISA